MTALRLPCSQHSLAAELLFNIDISWETHRNTTWWNIQEVGLMGWGWRSRAIISCWSCWDRCGWLWMSKKDEANLPPLPALWESTWNWHKKSHKSSGCYTCVATECPKARNLARVHIFVFCVCFKRSNSRGKAERCSFTEQHLPAFLLAYSTDLDDIPDTSINCWLIVMLTCSCFNDIRNITDNWLHDQNQNRIPMWVKQCHAVPPSRLGMVSLYHI